MSKLDSQAAKDILTKEVDGLINGSAPIIRVLAAIRSREEQMLLVRKLNKELSGENQKDALAKLSSELIKLRQVSIRTVELIVLWRDQLRHLSLIGANAKKSVRKRIAHSAIQIPFLTSEN